MSNTSDKIVKCEHCCGTMVGGPISTIETPGKQPNEWTKLCRVFKCQSCGHEHVMTGAWKTTKSNELEPGEQTKESTTLPTSDRSKLTWPQMAGAAGLSPDHLAQFSVDLLFQLWSRADDAQIICTIVENGKLVQVQVPHFLAWWRDNVLKPRLEAAKSMVEDALKIVGPDGSPVGQS